MRNTKKLTTIIFTGVSGGGKTTALRAVEDLGYYCVDNLPLPLLQSFIETMQADPVVDRAALVVDARLKHYSSGYGQAYATLRSRGHELEVVYLDARDDVLIRRFSQTRRRHPLARNDLSAGFAEERRLLSNMRAYAKSCIDTSELTVHQLKQWVQDRYGGTGEGLVVSLLSFGYRYGLPLQSDLVFDARFLPNPYFDERLRPLTGNDEAVSEYVFQQSDTQPFVERIVEWLDFILPRCEAEGKVYLTVSIGCTGGRHRSVAIVNELAKRIGRQRAVHVRHRDVSR